jgi:hypothetical protein
LKKSTAAQDAPADAKSVNFPARKIFVLFTASHSLTSSPFGSTTALRMFPLPSVALAYSDSLCRLPSPACPLTGLNVLFLFELHERETEPNTCNTKHRPDHRDKVAGRTRRKKRETSGNGDANDAHGVCVAYNRLLMTPAMASRRRKKFWSSGVSSGCLCKLCDLDGAVLSRLAYSVGHFRRRLGHKFSPNC